MDIRRPEINIGKKSFLKKFGENNFGGKNSFWKKHFFPANIFFPAKIFWKKNFFDTFFGKNKFGGKKFHRDRFSRLRETCNQRFVDNNSNNIY